MNPRCKRIRANVRGASNGITVGLFQGMALQESFSGTHDYSQGLVYSQHTDRNYNQSISDPSTFVNKRAQRSDDPNLLRRMDDSVGTGPEETSHERF